VARRILEADAHLAAGLAQMKEGHLNRAREEFDRALDAYLTAPGGAYSDPRLAEAYRRTLEVVQEQEGEAAAAGDAYAEAPPEPAAIDAIGDLPVSEEPATAAARARAEEAVESEVNDLPVQLNDAVLACVDLYQGRLREWFTAALARGHRYLPHIREVFAEEGIPQDLAYVALVESAFKPAAYSRAKAKGVWQFISATGRQYGLRQDWWVDERSDPEKATRAAAKHLKMLHGLFGDWDLALAAYNAGERKVLRGMNRYGTRDYWQLRKTRALRRETRNYVPLIHAAILVAKAPEKYGFQVTPELAPEYETVAIASAVDLRTVAECAGAPLDVVRDLNPELRRFATPAGRSYDLRVPPGTADPVAACLGSLPPEKRVRFRTHVVRRGQTIAGIAGANGIKPRDLADANGLSPEKRLRVGTELIIPVPAGKPGPVRRASAAGAPARRAPSPPDGATRILYTIKPGDTLTAIASQYGTTVRELQAWNGLRGSRIAAGGTLTIFTSRN
jgi:membrane-bound lytic murein transglycosylase D